MGLRTLKSIVELRLSGQLKNTMLDAINSGIKDISFNYQNSMETGVDTDQADRVWIRQAWPFTASQVRDIDLYDFTDIDIGGGNGNDALGQPLGLAQVTTLAVIVTSDDDNAYVNVGGRNASRNWSTPFDGNKNIQIPVYAGGFLLIHAPHVDAYEVVDNVDDYLTITRADSGISTLTVDVIVIGRSEDESSESSSSISVSSSSSSSSKSSSSSSSSDSSNSSSSSSLSSSSSSSTSSDSSSSASSNSSSSASSNSSSSNSSSSSSSNSSSSSSSSSSAHLYGQVVQWLRADEAYDNSGIFTNAHRITTDGVSASKLRDISGNGFHMSDISSGGSLVQHSGGFPYIQGAKFALNNSVSMGIEGDGPSQNRTVIFAGKINSSNQPGAYDNVFSIGSMSPQTDGLAGPLANRLGLLIGVKSDLTHEDMMLTGYTEWTGAGGSQSIGVAVSSNSEKPDVERFFVAVLCWTSSQLKLSLYPFTSEDSVAFSGASLDTSVIQIGGGAGGDVGFANIDVLEIIVMKANSYTSAKSLASVLASKYGISDAESSSSSSSSQSSQS